ncbi:hypothetical protein TEA_010129 [Camellia sinensis var. sinensis]|uniref:Uncharacterized protein n=1 Tax=Camellia sinensis var. sinensis TaxID=542762 RepID=A0A4S4DPA4_CAMSN|nr:hypothetical protein TEA_010129 [Camellia sinensis var. sinensis]
MESQIISPFNFFKSFVQSEEETIPAIKRNAKFLLVDLQACALPNVEILRETNVLDEKILFMLKFMAGAFNSTSDRFRKIVNEVKKMGFNPLKLNFVLAVHALKSMSKSTWGKKVDIYKKWVLFEDDILVAFGKYPWCTIASEHKIMRVMDFFVNKMKNDITLETMLKYIEKVFLTEVVNYYEEEALELLKLHKEKLVVAK